jgi:hypothetical protein
MNDVGLHGTSEVFRGEFEEIRHDHLGLRDRLGAVMRARQRRLFAVHTDRLLEYFVSSSR